MLEVVRRIFFIAERNLLDDKFLKENFSKLCDLANRGHVSFSEITTEEFSEIKEFFESEFYKKVKSLESSQQILTLLEIFENNKREMKAGQYFPSTSDMIRISSIDDILAKISKNSTEINQVHFEFKG